MNHLGGTNKMVRDTPRTDAVWELFATDSTLEPDVEFSGLARQLERELNAANAQVDRLTAKVAQLYEGAEEQKQRIKRLEEAGDILSRYLRDIPYASDYLYQSGERSLRINNWTQAKEDKL